VDLSGSSVADVLKLHAETLAELRRRGVIRRRTRRPATWRSCSSRGRPAWSSRTARRGRGTVATARQRRRRLCDQRPARRGRRLDERLRAVVL